MNPKWIPKKVRSPDFRPGFAVFLGLIAVLPFQAFYMTSTGVCAARYRRGTCLARKED